MQTRFSGEIFSSNVRSGVTRSVSSCGARPIAQPSAAAHTSDALRAGAVIGYPTEAVWGLGCDPENEAAVRQLLTLKQRPASKGLILVAASIEQFAPYLTQISADQYQQLQVSWPGFQTWVVPAPQAVPGWLKGDHLGIALRVSAHPVVRELCQGFAGPIVSSSANPAGQPPAQTAEQVTGYFPQGLACLLSGCVGEAPQPSSIIDITSGQVLR